MLSSLLAALVAALLSGGAPQGGGGIPGRGIVGGDEGIDGFPTANVTTWELHQYEDYSIGLIEWDIVPWGTWLQPPVLVTEKPRSHTSWNGLGMQTQLVHPTTFETAWVESSMEGNCAQAAEIHRGRVGALLDQGYEVVPTGGSGATLALVPELADLLGVVVRSNLEEGTFSFSQTVYHNVPHQVLGWVEEPVQVGYTTSPGEDPSKGLERFLAWVAKEASKGTFWTTPRNP